MFIVRQGDRLYAYRNSCPHHDNARMAWRKDQFLNHDRSRILCAAHGALFRIEDGHCETGPCIGDHLKMVSIEIRDELVFLTSPYRPGMPKRMGNGAT